MKRDWSEAHEKVAREGACRFCGGTEKVEAAHTVGRRYDQVEVGDHLVDVVWVNPDDVVPLCAACHRLYDAHKLDLVPHLSNAEQAAAARHVGLVRALHRLSGGGGDKPAPVR